MLSMENVMTYSNPTEGGIISRGVDTTSIKGINGG